MLGRAADGVKFRVEDGHVRWEGEKVGSNDGDDVGVGVVAVGKRGGRAVGRW